MRFQPGGVPRPSAPKAEIVSERDIALAIYERHDVATMIEQFGLSAPFGSGEPRPVTEQDLDTVFAKYATDLSPLALTKGHIDVVLLHAAFDLVIDDMNRVAHQKLEPETTIRRFGRAMLGKKQPNPNEHRHFAYLDETFWTTQFPQDFQRGQLPKRLVEESDTAYLARYFTQCLHGFALAPYSYLPQALPRK